MKWANKASLITNAAKTLQGDDYGYYTADDD